MMIFVLLVGIWLAISPTVERSRMQYLQKELLKNTVQSDSTAQILERVAVIAPNEDSILEAQDEVAFSAPIVTSDMPPMPEPSASEPVTDNDEIAGIGILTIDCIDATLPVTDGVSKEQLKFSEGWVPQTSPIGSAGNAVIAGHRSYTYGQHFNRLGELAVGDLIQYTEKNGEEMTFTVSEILTIEPGDPATFYKPTEGTAQLTLYTCTPIRTATHRLLVRALRTA